MTQDTPVLLVTWNRPELTRKVLEAIKVARPSQLFVAGDGPRHAEDKELIDEVRALVDEMVDWPCTVLTSFADSNLGCRLGVTRAIDWFFSHVEEGIILEDDCVPHPDFFRFCTEMLEEYRQNVSVMHISGDNSMQARLPRGESYCFIRYPHIWGWATWSRAWAKFDRNLDEFAKVSAEDNLRKIFPNDLERKIWVPIFSKLREENLPDTWDWRWSATLFVNDGLSIQPGKNLVSNIGHGNDSTHTRRKNIRADFLVEGIYPIVEPREVARNLNVEMQVIRNSQIQLIGQGLLRRALLKLTRLLGQIGRR